MKTQIPVGISARHIHISQEHLEFLFGDGYELTFFKDLSQPGQFAAEEKLTIRSESGREITGVRILGPVRKETQIEISRSDAIRNKFFAPVRSSGNIAGSGAAIIVGPNGTEIKISEGVIVADRHIHFSVEDGKEYGVKDKEVVTVKVEGKKGGTMDNVLCRVGKDYKLDFHIDVDDANAFDLSQGSIVEIIK